MTSPPHDVDLKYAQAPLGSVDDQFQFGVDEDGVTVSGACPRCHGPTSTTFPKGIAGSKGFPWFRRGTGSKAELEAAARAETMFCECGFTHAEQPEDTLFEGCGAQWTLKSGSGGTP
ncbi:hypothetical protein [Streptomyces sp. NPDC056479]|uniref:hypothetical protein n=1 Tax=unclassified Streptomyces TaxID=2593676 RepID=UPI0036BD44FC